jgi:hypothetical protein
MPLVGFGDTFENDLLKLIFNGTAIANIADNAASAPLTNLYIALHTADPDEAGTQSTSETSYTGYARVAVARTSGGWTVSGSSASLTAAVDFPECTGGTATITHATIGTLSSGAGKVIAGGAISPSIAVSSGVIPRLKTGTVFTLT